MKKIVLFIVVLFAPTLLLAQAVAPRPISNTPSFYLSQVTNTTQTVYAGNALNVSDSDSLAVFLETIDSVSVTNVKFINVTPNLTPIDTLTAIGSTFTNNSLANKGTFGAIAVNTKSTYIIPYVTAALSGAQTTNQSRVRLFIVPKKK